MAQVNIYMPDELHAEVKASGFNLSAVCQQAARAQLDMERAMSTLTRDMETITLDVANRDGESHKKRFIGHLIAGDVYDYAVYLTVNGRVAVHGPDNKLDVYDTFEDFAEAYNGHPDVVAEAAEALGEDFVEELDI